MRWWRKMDGRDRLIFIGEAMELIPMLLLLLLFVVGMILTIF